MQTARPTRLEALARISHPLQVAICALITALFMGCDTPTTTVVLDNRYAPSATSSLVIFDALWQAVSFPAPIPPGASSDPQDTVPATDNLAYVVLAPGLAVDPDGGASDPTTFVVLQSRSGFSVDLDHTLHIAVDDSTFAGNCAAGSVLTQQQADFITQRVFQSDFAGRHYDAATCARTDGP